MGLAHNSHSISPPTVDHFTPAPWPRTSRSRARPAYPKARNQKNKATFRTIGKKQSFDRLQQKAKNGVQLPWRVELIAIPGCRPTSPRLAMTLSGSPPPSNKSGLVSFDQVRKGYGQTKSIHRHTDTQTHRHTDTQTHRHTDTQTHRHTDTQTHRHTDTQTHRHTDTQTHRHTDTQTHRHTDTQTHIARHPPPSTQHTTQKDTPCQVQLACDWAHTSNKQEPWTASGINMGASRSIPCTTP